MDQVSEGGFAPYILMTTALTPEPDASGRSNTMNADIANITWIQARAEDLPAVAPGPYQLVTFGQSFYWTDEVPVAEAVYDMLEPGGALVLVWHQAEGRAVPPSPGPPRIPHHEIEEFVRKYLGPTMRAMPRRTSSATVSKNSPTRCESCCGSVLRRRFLGLAR
jgi:hypothetical protein